MDPLDEILARAAQRQQELDQMHADYEAIDAAEYAQFNAEMDAQDEARNRD
ncbi:MULTISPECIES: hypothetical protein [Streptomyces griseus group]|uniref:hypothetical protein n=1 Tax=Streptomyces griseus group TaxID=629295 RepID=UPI00192A9EFB|nr:hypothetical protein [Streptomyces microflavus]QQZ53280.1 hypothetical protein IFE09_06120 [Streptomyces microflavus]